MNGIVCFGGPDLSRNAKSLCRGSTPHLVAVPETDDSEQGYIRIVTGPES